MRAASAGPGAAWAIARAPSAPPEPPDNQTHPCVGLPQCHPARKASGALRTSPAALCEPPRSPSFPLLPRSGDAQGDVITFPAHLPLCRSYTHAARTLKPPSASAAAPESGVGSRSAALSRARLRARTCESECDTPAPRDSRCPHESSARRSRSSSRPTPSRASGGAPSVNGPAPDPAMCKVAIYLYSAHVPQH